jgi:hypothetical protein
MKEPFVEVSSLGRWRRGLLFVAAIAATLTSVIVSPAQATTTVRLCIMVDGHLVCNDITMPDTASKWPDPPPECMCILTMDLHVREEVAVQVIEAFGKGLSLWSAGRTGAAEEWYTVAARKLGTERLGVVTAGWFDTRAGRFDPQPEPWVPGPWVAGLWNPATRFDPDPQPWRADPSPDPWFGAAIVDVVRGVTLLQQSIWQPEQATAFRTRARSEFDEANQELRSQTEIDRR